MKENEQMYFKKLPQNTERSNTTNSRYILRSLSVFKKYIFNILKFDKICLKEIKLPSKNVELPLSRKTAFLFLIN